MRKVDLLFHLSLFTMVIFITEGNENPGMNGEIKQRRRISDRIHRQSREVNSKEKVNEFFHEVRQPVRKTRRWPRKDRFRHKYYDEEQNSENFENHGSHVESYDENWQYKNRLEVGLNSDKYRRNAHKSDDRFNKIREKMAYEGDNSRRNNDAENDGNESSRRGNFDDTRQERDSKWEEFPGEEVDFRPGREHSEKGSDNVPHEDLDPEPNLNHEDLESEPHEDPEPDEDEEAEPVDDEHEVVRIKVPKQHDKNPYQDYFKPEPEEHGDVEPAPKIVVEKPSKFWHPIKKFFTRRIPALCRLYTHHEKGVESILMSFLNMGSKPVHSAIMKYCNKKIEEEEREKGNEDNKPKSTMGRLFGWLSKKLGFSGEKNKGQEVEVVTEKTSLHIDNDESVVIQPKVVNLIISPKAALTVHKAIEDNMDIEGHEENLERLENEALDAERLRFGEKVHDHFDLEEENQNDLYEKLHKKVDENFREETEDRAHNDLDEQVHEELDEKDHEDYLNKDDELLDENFHEELKENEHHENIHEIDDAIRQEIWEGVEKNLEDSYKNEHKKLRMFDSEKEKLNPHHHSSEVPERERRNRKRKRNAEEPCQGKECEIKMIRKSIEKVASADLDSSKDLDELAEIIGGFKMPRAKPRVKSMPKRIIKAEHTDNGLSDEDKYYNFLEKFTMPQLESDKFEDEAKDMPLVGDIVTAEEDVALKANHHHHPNGSHSIFASVSNFIKRHEILFIIIAAIFLLPLLCLFLFFCWKKCSPACEKFINGAGGITKGGMSKVGKWGKGCGKGGSKTGKRRKESEESDDDGQFIDVTISSANESDYVEEITPSPRPLTKKGGKESRSESLERDRKKNKPSAKNTRSGGEPWLSSEGSWGK